MSRKEIVTRRGIDVSRPQTGTQLKSTAANWQQTFADGKRLNRQERKLAAKSLQECVHSRGGYISAKEARQIVNELTKGTGNDCG